MKKMFRNNRFKLFACVMALSAWLATKAEVIKPKSPVPAVLVYIGSIQNQPLFQLRVTGDSQQDEFILHITDDAGVSLYRENIRGSYFSKKFLLNTDEIGDNTLRFEVYSKKTKQSIMYEVNRHTRFVGDIARTQVPQ